MFMEGTEGSPKCQQRSTGTISKKQRQHESKLLWNSRTTDVTGMQGDGHAAGEANIFVLHQRSGRHDVVETPEPGNDQFVRISVLVCALGFSTPPPSDIPLFRDYLNWQRWYS